MLSDDSAFLTLSHHKTLISNRLERYAMKTLAKQVRATDSDEKIKSIAKMLSIFARKRGDYEALAELKWADLI